MSEPVCFENPVVLKQSEQDQIRHFESFFLIQKARESIPVWDVFVKNNGKEPTGITKRAYALALLSRKNLYGEKMSLPRELNDYRPFESDGNQNTPTMRELMKWPGSLAFFPTIDKNDENVAYCNMMFLFRPTKKNSYQDNRSILCGKSIISNDSLIYILKRVSHVEEMYEGDSWQLAYAIAEKALDEPQKRNAPLDYLITGKLEGRNIKAVKIGSKSNLLEDYLTLLAPEDNKKVLEKKDNFKYRFADNIDNAWRIVSGNGFTEKTILLPNPIKELHVLVGKSIQHLLYVIFCLAPEKTILWHSNDSSEEATIIQKLFDQLRKEHVVGKDVFRIQKKEMDSHNMQKCYESITKSIRSKKLKDLDYVVINNTGGNRLMGFAALLAARDLGITVVYRDIDAPPDVMTGVRFEHGLNINNDIENSNRWSGKQIKWEELYNKPDPNSPPFPRCAEQIKRRIFS